MTWFFALFACAAPLPPKPPPTAQCGFEMARRVGRLKDGRLDEVSGLVQADDTWWVHNDSGDDARFFALDPTTGKTTATYRLRGVEAVDWEDMALERHPDGATALLFGDIGDNLGVRDHVQIHRVALPHERGRVMVEATSYTVRYPDGAHNAESLFFEPSSGEVWIITKQRGGVSGFYSASLPTEAGDVSLVHRGSVTFPSESRGSDLSTAATLSPDGRELVVRTYTDAWVWTVDEGIAAALDKPPCRIRLRAEEQGEAIAWTADGLLTVSEGLRSSFWLYARQP